MVSFSEAGQLDLLGCRSSMGHFPDDEPCPGLSTVTKLLGRRTYREELL